eukprot:TRINITY_DN2173_c3_g1_i1.p3 TRINITY_DN2173_c3_g1~~TRINITY_DN2173_c3_g1_i1.p3  ORF type:complete len:124 (-),score=12.07 TRINITY_DN2173_c3_g1_i1:291-662(-)
MFEEKQLMTLACPNLFIQLKITLEDLEYTESKIFEIVQCALKNVPGGDVGKQILFEVAFMNSQLGIIIISIAKENRIKFLQAFALMQWYEGQYCRTQVMRVSPFLGVLAFDSHSFVDSIQFPQ